MDNEDLIRRLSRRRVNVTIQLNGLRAKLCKAGAAEDLETQGTVPYLLRGIATLQATVASLTRRINSEHQQSKLSISSGS